MNQKQSSRPMLLGNSQDSNFVLETLHVGGKSSQNLVF